MLGLASDDGKVRLFLLGDNLELQPWFTLNGHCGAIEQIKLSRDDRFLAAFGRNVNHVTVWDLNQLAKLAAND